MYQSTTNDISVTVFPEFLEGESEPELGHFVWTYTVAIENKRQSPIQILSRRWFITDSNGVTEEVVGAGVGGEEPTLAPGEIFEYTSGAPLRTESGIMVGTYGIQDQSGQKFEVDIPAFSLDSPGQIRVLN